MSIESHLKILSISDSFQNPGHEVFYICKVNWFTRKYNINCTICCVWIPKLSAGYNINKHGPDPYQKNLSCYGFGSVVLMCLMIGEKKGGHWLNTLESGFRLLWDCESQWENCWSKDHREIGPGHVLMQMSIVFLTSMGLQRLIPDEVMRWFGCAVPSWKAVERCSEIRTGIASPETNAQHNSVPFKQTWKGKEQQHLSLWWQRNRLWGRGQKTVVCLVIRSLEERQ